MDVCLDLLSGPADWVVGQIEVVYPELLRHRVQDFVRRTTPDRVPVAHGRHHRPMDIGLNDVVTWSADGNGPRRVDAPPGPAPHRDEGGAHFHPGRLLDFPDRLPHRVGDPARADRLAVLDEVPGLRASDGKNLE